MKLFITFTSTVLLGMQSVNAAIHGGGGILPDDMKSLLHDKYTAVDVAAACEAIRGQRCVVGDERFACAQLPHIHSRCSGVHHSRTADGKHGLYCTQSELTDYEDNEFVDVLATHGTTDCAVLSAGDGCVDDTATVGLKCKDGLTCEGFAKSTVAGTPDTLGTCKGTAAKRNSEPAASEPAASEPAASEPAAPPAPTPAASPSSPATEAPSSGIKAGLFALHISVAVGVLHYFLL